MITKLGEVIEQRQPLKRMKATMPHGVNSLLLAFDREAGVPGLRVDISCNSRSMQLNGLFLNSGVFGTLQGKAYRTLDMVLSIIEAYIDRVTGFRNDTSMTCVNRMYSDIVFKVLSQSYSRGWSVTQFEKLRKEVFAFKHKAVNTFLLVCASGLFTLKFYILNRLIKEISRFGGISALDASPCEKSNRSMDAAYRYMSKRPARCMDEMVFGLAQLQTNAP